MPRQGDGSGGGRGGDYIEGAATRLRQLEVWKACRKIVDGTWDVLVTDSTKVEPQYHNLWRSSCREALKPRHAMARLLEPAP